MENLLIQALRELLQPTALIVRRDSPLRILEGLPQAPATILGNSELARSATVVENNVKFGMNAVDGQKTGWFYDQRANRARIATLAGKVGSVLDLFTYSGGFAVQAAVAGANRVLAVDSSATALELASQAAKQNGVDSVCTFVKGDAMHVLQEQAAAGMAYDVVIADPPPYVPSRKHLAVGLKAYRKLAQACARVVAPGGLLFLASCSHNVPQSMFLAEVSIGIGRAGRQARLLQAGGADCE